MPIAPLSFGGSNRTAAADTGTLSPWDSRDPVDDTPLPQTKVSVLVVDDQPANLLAMEATLADLDLNLVTAGSGFEALRCLLGEDVALKLDPATRSLVYAGAGHLPGYVFDAAGEVKAQLESTGFPLGVLPDTDYPAESAPSLEPGEMVLLVTDGIVEAHGPDENLFGIERALRLVKAHRDRPAREVLNALFGAVRDFCGPTAQLDDMTAIVIKAGAPGVPGGGKPAPVC